MAHSIDLVEVWRGDFLESVHSGHVVICNSAGDIEFALGDPQLVVLPRSSIKMIQALPLVESGAADACGLQSENLAMACASHLGSEVHTRTVAALLESIGLGERNLKCGTQLPKSHSDRQALWAAGTGPSQLHNNCSGKHAGFLATSAHLGCEPSDYLDPKGKVQSAVRNAFEDMVDAPSPGFAIDGCSAPNYAASLQGIARAMANFAVSESGTGVRNKAATRLWQAMAAHPELVAGEGASCTKIIRLAGGAAVVKTGAEGVYTGILPGLGLGVALKIVDGASRAAEVAIAAVLARLKVFDALAPDVAEMVTPKLTNRAGLNVGTMKPTKDLLAL